MLNCHYTPLLHNLMMLAFNSKDSAIKNDNTVPLGLRYILAGKMYVRHIGIQFYSPFFKRNHQKVVFFPLVHNFPFKNYFVKIPPFTNHQISVFHYNIFPKKLTKIINIYKSFFNPNYFLIESVSDACYLS